MNPGLVVKLRPVGPWRIGPDTGARNRVDTIFHSDTLYAAVTSAMARLGSLEDWLNATARNGAPAVSFSSCFPFLDEIGFVVPPRTVWPPTAPALMGARVRWKSARFVPLGIVQALLAGQSLEESHWSVDGPSECLVPAGRPGPFRTGLRWNAAVDRLTGSAERHSTACIEFRAGSGLWTVVAFADEPARARWMEPVKAAFRELADSGLGGERSRGWGRADTPEFLEGTLPDMILGAPQPPAEVEAAPLVIAPREEPMETPIELAPAQDAVPEPEPEPTPEAVAAPEPEVALEPPAVEIPEDPPVVPPPLETAAVTDAPEIAPLVVPVAPKPAPPTKPNGPTAHWMLSLFTPAATDAIDWTRGNYTLLARAGRVESPAGSGELKKTLPMVAEGSVVYAAGMPRGSAPDVAPDGFAHPVFRSGFAVAIPLPEVS
jgi:CRISPR type III-A-associated RAMP protein Csm4